MSTLLWDFDVEIALFYSFNHLFAELYDIKYSYQIQIIFNQLCFQLSNNSKLVDCSRGQHEGSLFNNYNTKE